MKFKTNEASKLFIKELKKLLEERGLLDSLDSLALDMLQVSVHKYIEATTVLLSEGSTYTVTNSNGEAVFRDRPEVKQSQLAHIEIVKLLQEFGLSPASRKRVKDTITVKEEFDPLAAFLGTKEVR